MQEHLREWLVHSGFPEETTVLPMHGSLGGTTLWRVSPATDGAPLVARVFTPEAEADAEREAQAMRVAAEHAVPVPAVVLLGCMDPWPVLETTFAAGQPVSDLLRQRPERAGVIGRVMGEALGRLHEISAPVSLPVCADDWLSRGSEALAPIRHLLERVPDHDRLLHLDYHPDNVLTDGEGITVIIDWENSMPGPPHMDLARSQAVLWAVRRGKLAPDAMPGALDDLESGLVAGHAAVAGEDPHAALSAAWGMAMTTADLAQHLGKPESWLTEEVIGPLRDEGDRRILAVLDAAPA